MRTDGHFVDYPMPIEDAQIPISRVTGQVQCQYFKFPITAFTRHCEHNQRGAESNGHQIDRLLRMERAKVRPCDKIFSLVRIYFVDGEQVPFQLPILSNEVVGFSCLCV